jgi:hypothetical protein
MRTAAEDEVTAAAEDTARLWHVATVSARSPRRARLFRRAGF